MRFRIEICKIQIFRPLRYPELAGGPHNNLCRNPGGNHASIGCFPLSGKGFERCAPDLSGQGSLLFEFRTCSDAGAKSKGPVQLRLNGEAVLTVNAEWTRGTYTVPYAGALETLALTTDAKDGWGICELRVDRRVWTGLAVEEVEMVGGGGGRGGAW